MEKLKKEFEQLFTKDATEIASIPKRRLAGNPQELWLWILNNFNVKVSQMQLPVKPERAEMKLYKVLLAYSYNNEKIFTFLVVASCIEEATDLAIKTFKSYDYGDCQFSSVSLLAEEGQYGKPQILIIAEH